VWGGVRLEEPGQVHVPVDSKSALQELAQARKLPVPRYVIVHESGPEHAKTFTVEARVGKELSAKAQGSSKKAAGQKAAEFLLEQLRAMPVGE
jgi:ribonuclease-3